MNDDERDELASAYLDGEITDEERRMVENDPGLRARVEQLRAVTAALAEPPSGSDDSARREAAIAAALAERGAGRPDAPPSLTAARSARHPVWRRLVPLGAVAALLVVAGIVANALPDEGDSDDSAAESSDTLAAQLAPEPREEIVTPDAGREDGTAAAEESAGQSDGDDSAETTAAADDDSTSGGDGATGEAATPATTAAAGSGTTERLDDAPSDDAPSGDEETVEHRCDDAVRSVDRDLGALLRVGGPDADGRDTLTYAVPGDPGGERDYAVDPDDCADPERLTGTGG